MKKRGAEKTDQSLSLFQISHICTAYNIGELINVLKQRKDTANININIITETGKYVIKLFTCNPERFDFIADMLCKLQLEQLPVLVPLKNNAGKYCVEVYPWMLQITKFVYGYPFMYSPIQAMNSGKMLRRFHDALSDVESYVSPIASLYPSNDILVDAVGRLKGMGDEFPAQQIDSITRLYEEIIEKWETSCPELPQTIIHGDWHQNNLIFNKDEDVCSILDFDFMTRAERIFDVAYALWRLRFSNDDKELASAFMKGYGTLTDEEIEMLPLEICRIVYYYICSSTLSLNPKYELTNHLKNHYQFLRWVMSEDGRNVVKDLCIIDK
ncbi:MAG: phosphotransferase [Pseudomonadota bacterium]